MVQEWTIKYETKKKSYDLINREEVVWVDEHRYQLLNSIGALILLKELKDEENGVLIVVVTVVSLMIIILLNYDHKTT